MKHSTKIKFLGHELYPVQWSLITGISLATIMRRLKTGWDPQKAICTLTHGMPGLPRGIPELIEGKTPEEILLERGIDWFGRPLSPEYIRVAQDRLARSRSRSRRGAAPPEPERGRFRAPSGANGGERSRDDDEPI